MADQRALEPLEPSSDPIDPGTTVGHVHLKVSDLRRSVAFYRDVLGFDVNQFYGDPDGGGPAAAFLSAGGYHHHIGLNTWQSLGGGRPRPGTTGLYHAAILVPSRRELARVLRRLQEAGWPLQGAADHGVSEALYLADPDGNGLEIYRDRPPEEWPKVDGVLRMVTEPLDLGDLLAELED